MLRILKLLLDIFKQAFDLDPLEYTYALKRGLALYQNNQFEEAIRYFDITQILKKML